MSHSSLTTYPPTFQPLCSDTVCVSPWINGTVAASVRRATCALPIFGAICCFGCLLTFIGLDPEMKTRWVFKTNFKEIKLVLYSDQYSNFPSTMFSHGPIKCSKAANILWHTVVNDSASQLPLLRSSFVQMSETETCKLGLQQSPLKEAVGNLEPDLLTSQICFQYNVGQKITTE